MARSHRKMSNWKMTKYQLSGLKARSLKFKGTIRITFSTTQKDKSIILRWSIWAKERDNKMKLRYKSRPFPKTKRWNRIWI